MSIFAVIKTGGKQYKVAEGDVLEVEKLHTDSAPSAGDSGNANAPMRMGDSVTFNEVLLVGDGSDAKVGKPLVSGVKVEAKVIEDGKAKKKIVFRYKAKTRYRKKKGHRQPYTKIQITKIAG